MEKKKIEISISKKVYIVTMANVDAHFVLRRTSDGDFSLEYNHDVFLPLGRVDEAVKLLETIMPIIKEMEAKAKAAE